jgi:hypothetical protein
MEWLKWWRVSLLLTYFDLSEVYALPLDIFFSF